MNIQHYKQRLLDLEKTLSSRTERALADGRGQFIDSAHDLGESSVADVAAEEDFTEAELDSTILKHLQEALGRIAEGTFGKCLVDGGPIEEKRLEAIPWAQYCLKHQGLIEAAARPRPWTLSLCRDEIVNRRAMRRPRILRSRSNINDTNVCDSLS